MKLVKILLVAGALFIFALACSQPSANTSSTPDNDGKKMAPVTNGGNSAASASPVKDEMAQAADLYTTHCMTCHKDSGKGGKVTVEGKNLDVDDLTTEKKKARTDEKLTNDIAEGAEDDGMPAFKKKLKPEEIALIVKHVRVLQAK